MNDDLNTPIVLSHLLKPHALSIRALRVSKTIATRFRRVDRPVQNIPARSLGIEDSVALKDSSYEAFEKAVICC